MRSFGLLTLLVSWSTFLLPTITDGKCYEVTILAQSRMTEAVQDAFGSNSCPMVLIAGDTIDIRVIENGSDCHGHWCTIRRNGLLTDSVSFYYGFPFSDASMVVTIPGTYQIRAGLLYNFFNETASLSGMDAQLSLTVIPEILTPGTVRLGMRGVCLESSVSLTGTWSSITPTLWDADRIPNTEPYTALGFNYGGAGGETLPDFELLAVSAAVVDWIRLELYEDVQLLQCIAAANALLSKNGVVRSSAWGSNIEFQAPIGEYYLRVVHRNHLPVTFGPIQFDQFGPCMIANSDDWPVVGEDTRVTAGTIPRTLRAGNALLETGPQRISYAGANNDRDAILQRIGGVDPIATVSGYYIEDVNMDGVVKYTGANNDRDVVLRAIGGENPIAVVSE